MELFLCSLLTILPDYLYRRYAQGKRGCRACRARRFAGKTVTKSSLLLVDRYLNRDRHFRTLRAIPRKFA
jgi:hypothetical protein